MQAARVDGALVGIEPPPRLAKSKEHTIDLIVFYGKLAALVTFSRELRDRQEARHLTLLLPQANSPSGCTTHVPEDLWRDLDA